MNESVILRKPQNESFAKLLVSSLSHRRFREIGLDPGLTEGSLPASLEELPGWWGKECARLGRLLRERQEIFLSTFFFLSAITVDFREDLLQEVLQGILQMDLFQEARNLAHGFPILNSNQTIPTIESIRRTIEKIEKMAEMGNLNDAHLLASELSKSHLSGKLSNALGFIAFRQGLEEKARQWFKTALVISPLDPDIRGNAEGTRSFPSENIPTPSWTETDLNDFRLMLDLLEVRSDRNPKKFVSILAGLAVSNSPSPESKDRSVATLRFFLGIRGVFLELLGKSHFTNEIFSQIHLLFTALRGRIPFPIPPDRQIEANAGSLNTSLPERKNGEKFLFTHVVALLETLNDRPVEKIQNDFLKRLFEMQPASLSAGMPPTASTTDLIKPTLLAVIPTLTAAVKTFSRCIERMDFHPSRPFEFKLIVQWLGVFWNIYGPERQFLGLYESFKALFRRAIAMDFPELVFDLHFPLSHVYLNLTHTPEEWKVFNQDIEIPFSDYLREKIAPRYGLKPVKRVIPKGKGPLRVAFVYDRIIFHSPFKVLYSLLRNLVEHDKERRFEFFVYDLEYIEKSFSNPEAVKLLKDLGVRYCSNHDLIEDRQLGHYYSKLQKCLKLRERVISDGIDVLIPGDGREQFNVLFSIRAAPVQLFWSHGMHLFDLPGIDGRFTHVGFDTPEIEFSGMKLKGLVMTTHPLFYIPDVSEELLRNTRAKFPSEAIILGSIGRTIKVDSDPYLDAVFEILRLNPQCIYLCCGYGGVARIMERVKEANLEKRFHFTGHVDPHLYGHIIDLYLNTFPLRSGEAIWEFLAKGKPAISLFEKDKFEENFQSLISSSSSAEVEELLGKEGFSLRDYRSTVVFSPEKYVEAAGNLIRNPEARDRQSRFHAAWYKANVRTMAKRTYQVFSTMTGGFTSAIAS